MARDVIVVIFVVVILLLGWSWRAKLGTTRGSLAALCRLLWLLPLLLALWPRLYTIKVAQNVVQRVLHILVDDSDSMAGTVTATQNVLWQAQQSCQELGCKLQLRYLSELSAETRRGYTPLSLVLRDWLTEVDAEAWLLLSDGGDLQPQLAWQAVLAVEALSDKGLVLSFAGAEHKNLSLAEIDLMPLAFENTPADVQLSLQRTPALAQERVQVQVTLDDKVLVGKNVVFADMMEKVSLTLPVPELTRGTHLVQVEVLPPRGERVLWDNSRAVLLEVLPNTVGALHLLGSPSWDGSFVRRYLKSEPRYDLISFFILRDHLDNTQVDERELSLIPFPVDQLFGEELKNFRVVIIQNFSLARFLRPQHQQNLVDFILRGGALLFIGGPRALQYTDIMASPLHKILHVDKRTATLQRQHSNYQADLAFKLQFARPSAEQRALASIYDDWLEMQEELLSFADARGLNRLLLSGDEYTPLLNAVSKDGVTLPLLVASYPGKGRALWLFSDTFWRLAMTGMSRYYYHNFLQAGMTWLLKRDLQRPLQISKFVLQRDRHLNVVWQLELHGAATKYFSLSKQWQLQLCGQVLDWSQVNVEVLGPHHKHLAGQIAINHHEKCRVKIAGVDKAFGALQAESVALLPALYKDTEVGRAPAHAEALASSLHVPFTADTDKFSSMLSMFMSQHFSEAKFAPRQQEKTENDYFWILHEPWYLLLLLFLPAEVLLRRWREIG